MRLGEMLRHLRDGAIPHMKGTCNVLLFQKKLLVFCLPNMSTFSLIMLRVLEVYT